jgi:hypothetical protein
MHANAPTLSRPYIAFMRWTQKTVFELFMALEPRLKAMGANHCVPAPAEGGDIGLEFEINGLRLALTCEAPAAALGRVGDAGESVLVKFRIRERDGSDRLGWQEEIARYEIGFAGAEAGTAFLDEAAADLGERIRSAVGPGSFGR